MSPATGTLLGIDFSGGAGPWRPKVRYSTVWIARAEWDPSGLRLVALGPVQDLPGDEPPFDRLVRLLAGADYDVAAIDAPLCIPERHLPAGGREALLREIAALPPGPDRPFPTGPALIEFASRIAPLASAKPLRPCEAVWSRWKDPGGEPRGRRVNTRSTLWWKPRGGAPFAAACLALIARSRRPCWPWSRTRPGLLAEAFPAAQLRFWGLPHEGYAAPGATDVRRRILDALDGVLAIGARQRETALHSTDALDAILCVLAAYAVATGRLGVPPDPAVTDGWIAVLERPAARISPRARSRPRCA